MVCSEAFCALDDYMWKLTHKWATFSHSNKSKHWGHRPVLRHVQQVQARSLGVWRPRQRRLPAQGRLDADRPTPDGQRRGSPDDPALADYWVERRRKVSPPRRSARPTCSSSRRRPFDVRSAAARSLTPTTCHKAHASGSSGWPPPNERS
ncbi:MAG: hypothetical protein ACLP01_24735 [Solirubrobacteraceae bacterium]